MAACSYIRGHMHVRTAKPQGGFDQRLLQNPKEVWINGRPSTNLSRQHTPNTAASFDTFIYFVSGTMVTAVHTEQTPCLLTPPPDSTQYVQVTALLAACAPATISACTHPPTHTLYLDAVLCCTDIPASFLSPWVGQATAVHSSCIACQCPQA